jgi:hypothetical protein
VAGETMNYNIIKKKCICPKWIPHYRGKKASCRK